MRSFEKLVWESTWGLKKYYGFIQPVRIYETKVIISNCTHKLYYWKVPIYKLFGNVEV